MKGGGRLDRRRIGAKKGRWYIVSSCGRWQCGVFKHSSQLSVCYSYSLSVLGWTSEGPGFESWCDHLFRVGMLCCLALRRILRPIRRLHAERRRRTLVGWLTVAFNGTFSTDRLAYIVPQDVGL